MRATAPRWLGWHSTAISVRRLARQRLRLRHRLESVKLLPPLPGINAPELYGAVTASAASLVETRPQTGNASSPWLLLRSGARLRTVSRLDSRPPVCGH